MPKILTRAGAPVFARSGLPRYAYDVAAPNSPDYGSGSRITRRIAASGEISIEVKVASVPAGVALVIPRTATTTAFGVQWGNYPSIVPVAGVPVRAGVSQYEDGAWTAWLLAVDSSGRVGSPVAITTETVDERDIPDDVTLLTAGVLSPNPQTEGEAVGYTPGTYNGNPTSITFSYQDSADGVTGWTEFASRDQSAPLTAWPGSLDAYVSIVEKVTGQGIVGTLDTRSAAIAMNEATTGNVSNATLPVLSPNPQARGGLIQVVAGGYNGVPTSYAYTYQDSANGTTWADIIPDTLGGSGLYWPMTARAYVRAVEKVTGQGIVGTLDTPSAAIALLAPPAYDFLTTVVRWANTGTGAIQYLTPEVSFTNKPAGVYGSDWFVDWSTDSQIPPRDGTYETDAGKSPSDTSFVVTEVSPGHWQIAMGDDARNVNPATQVGARTDFSVFAASGTPLKITEAARASRLSFRYRTPYVSGPWSVPATVPNIIAPPTFELAPSIIRFDNPGTASDYVAPVITGASFSDAPSGVYGIDWWVGWTDDTYSGRLVKQGDGTYQPFMLAGNGNPALQSPRTDFSVWHATGVPLTIIERARADAFKLRYETLTQQGFWSAATPIPEYPDTTLVAPVFSYGATIIRYDNASIDYATPVITAASFANHPAGVYGTDWWAEWSTSADAVPTTGIEAGNTAVRKQGDGSFQIFMATTASNGNPAAQSPRADFSVFGFDGAGFTGGGDVTRCNNLKLRYATPSSTGPWSAASPIPLPALLGKRWYQVINRTQEQFEGEEFGGPGIQFVRDWGNSPNDPEFLIAPMDENLPWASSNFGGDFYTPEGIGLWAGKSGSSIWVDPENANHVLALYCSQGRVDNSADDTAMEGLFESSDRGETWRLARPMRVYSTASDGRRDNLHLIVSDPSTSGSVRHIYAWQCWGTSGTTSIIQLWRSTNNGQTWSKRGAALSPAAYASGTDSVYWAAFAPDGSSMFIATKKGVFRSRRGTGNDIGLAWELCAGFPTAQCSCIRTAGGVGETVVLWVASSNQGSSAVAADGVYKSTDSGATAVKKLGSYRARNVNVSPVNSSLIWTNAKGEKPKNSIDGGETWYDVLTLPMSGQDGGATGFASQIGQEMSGFHVAHLVNSNQVFVPRFQHLGSSETADIAGPRYAKQSGTGNGTVTGIAAQTGSGASAVFAQPGRYILTATGATAFTVRRPDGTMAPNATVGTTYSNNGLTFKINAGSTAWAAGAVIHLWTNMMVHFSGNGYDGCHTRGVGFHPTNWLKMFLAQQDKVGDYTDTGCDYFYGDCHQGSNDVGALVKAATNPSGLSWQGGSAFITATGRVVYSAGDGQNHNNKCVIVVDDPQNGSANVASRLSANAIHVYDQNPGNSQVNAAALDPNDGTVGYIGSLKVSNLGAANAAGLTITDLGQTFCGLANVGGTTYLYGADNSSGTTIYRKTAAAGSWASWYTLKNRDDRTTSSSSAVPRSFRSGDEATHLVVGVDRSNAARVYLSSVAGGTITGRDGIVVVVEGASPAAGSEKKVFDPNDPLRAEYMSRELSGATKWPDGSPMIHPHIRVGSIAVDPNDSNVVYVAMLMWGAEKNVFRTRNALGSWQKVGVPVGNGTITGLSSTESVDYGWYTATCATAAANGGTFTVKKPDGTTLDTWTVGVAKTAGGLTMTIADGSADWAVGDTLRIHPMPIWEDITFNAPRCQAFLFIHPLTSDVLYGTSHGMYVFPAATKRTNSLYDRIKAFADPILPQS